MWQRIKDFFDIGVTPTPSFVPIRYLYIGTPKLYDYKGLPNCPKCDYGNYPDLMQTVHIKELNVLKRICSRCSWSWFERCADGSEPNPEVDWDIVSGKETTK